MVNDRMPVFLSIRFTCPHCKAFAHQYWGEARAHWLGKDETPVQFNLEKLEAFAEQHKEKSPEDRPADYFRLDDYKRQAKGDVFATIKRGDPYSYQVFNLDLSRCDSCREVCVWMNGRMVYPASGPGALPNDDMPIRVKELFLEAGAVFTTSPRASAALLRLALQHLLDELGEAGKSIHSNIETLSESGLSNQLVKIMHSLRIIGNESVHPGTISVEDEPYMAQAMFALINQVVDELITRPREQEELWKALPKAKTEPVEKKLKPK